MPARQSSQPASESAFGTSGGDVLDSPLPWRTPADQTALTRLLLTFPTLAERLRHLIDNESFCYILDDKPLRDPAMIATRPRGMKRKRVWPPKIAEWVSQRTGVRFTRQALYKLRDGISEQAYSSNANALGAFWRIDHLLLDPSVPASTFTEADAEADDLDELDRQAMELIAAVGVRGIRSRDVQAALGESDPTQRRAFIEILEAIHRDRHNHSDNEPTTDTADDPV